MYDARLRATNCLGCGGPMSGGGRIDRRYCRPSCRTLAYRIRLRTRGIEHGPTAVPRWAIGRLPELSIALTTLGRAQGNITVLARQMECEEASVRAWLLRLRDLGDTTPDVPPPEPEIRLRAEADRLRYDLDEALAQRNKLDEELRANKAETSAAIARLHKELECTRQQLDDRASLLTQIAGETATLKLDAGRARLRIQELQVQHGDDQAEISRLQQALSTAKNNLKSGEEKLSTVEQDRTRLRDEITQMSKEVVTLRDASKKIAGTSARSASGSPSAPRQQVFEMPDTIPTSTKSASDSVNEARSLMDEQVAKITRLVCVNFWEQTKQVKHGESVQLWLSQHGPKIHQAAQMLARVALTARIGQEGATTVTKAAHEAYRQALDRASSHPSAFASWFQESEDFLIFMATALITGLDVRTSTDFVTATKAAAPHVQNQSLSMDRARTAPQESELSRRSVPQPDKGSASTQRKIPPR